MTGIKKIDRAELENLVNTYTKISEIDAIVDRFTDLHNREDPRIILPSVLSEIAKTMDVPEIFFQYKNPRTFEKNEDPNYTTLISNGSELMIQIEITDAIIDRVVKYVKHESSEPISVDYRKNGKQNLYGLPIFGGSKKNYVGVIGMVSEREHTDLDFKMLQQAASRLDTYMREKILQSERHRIMRKCARALGKPGLEGIGESIQYLTEFTEVPSGLAIYLEQEIDREIPPEKRNVDTIWVEKGEIVEKTEEHSKLSNGPGGSLIAYPRKKITDSKSGSRTIGIIKNNSETKEDVVLNYSCQDLTNIPNDPDHIIGKLVLIGGDQLRQADVDLAETVALQMYNKISYVHEQKKALSRSLHHEQVDFFIRKPEIAEWFFKNPREEIIGMVFTDICGYTTITRKLNSPRKTIEGARDWIMKEKELMHEFGGYFDKEVGDCAIALFGPPFCGISLEALNNIKNVDELEEVVARSQSEPHVYAYNSVLYALESVEAVKKFYMGEKQLNISVGVEVGKIALGDLTGVIGKLTAMGDRMNLAARLQGLAGHGEILIGPQCNAYLEEYQKEAWMGKLPFKIEPNGSHKLKGYEDPVPVFKVYR